MIYMKYDDDRIGWKHKHVFHTTVFAQNNILFNKIDFLCL